MHAVKQLFEMHTCAGCILICTCNLYTSFYDFTTHVDLVKAMESEVKWLIHCNMKFPWLQDVHSKHAISTRCHNNYIVLAIWLPWFCTSCISIVYGVLVFDRCAHLALTMHVYTYILSKISAQWTLMGNYSYMYVNTVYFLDKLLCFNA